MLMIPVILLATLLVLGRYSAAAHRAATATDTPPRFASPTLPIMGLVGVCISAMIMEGAGIDWSAIFMRDEFGAEPFWAGFAVALVAGSQAVARFFADGVVERYNPVSVARVLLLILLAGSGLMFWASAGWMAYLGLACIGVGSSALFPLAMSAAAQRTDRPASVNVAALTQIAFGAFLLGPPLLGYIGEHFGLHWAFGVGIPLTLIGLFTAQSLRPRAAPTAVVTP